MTETVPSTVVDLLTSEPLVGHLATCLDGRPHVAPLWYRYESGAIEIMTAGQKLSNIERNPRVALSVQKDTGGSPEWMVTVRGRAHIIEDEEVTRVQNRKLNEKYGADRDAWEENTLVRIDIGSATYKQY